MNALEAENLDNQKDEQWVSAADLLGGTLIIFFLLMLYFLLTQQEQSRNKSEIYTQTVAKLEQELQRVARNAQLAPESIKEVAVTYDQKRSEIYQALVNEFSGDLPKWNAEIDEDLTVRFNEPSVLFSVGSATIRPRFKRILEDFFPRYLAAVTDPDFKKAIAEVRIEGHTSSFWNLGANTPEQVAYLNNMDLSYQRSRSVLRYVMGLGSVSEDLPFLRKHLTANGLSSSKRILNDDGNEDFARSQRVEFRIRTDVESRIAKILDEAPQ